MKNQTFSIPPILAAIVFAFAAPVAAVASDISPALTSLWGVRFEPVQAGGFVTWGGELTASGWSEWVKTAYTADSTAVLPRPEVTPEQLAALSGKVCVDANMWDFIELRGAAVGINLLANYKRSAGMYPVGNAMQVYTVEYAGGGNPFMPLPNTPRFVNISVRTLVPRTGNTIPGFVIEGSPQKVLVRAIGPSLKLFGVPTVLSDPKLTLYSGSDALISNDDWCSDPTAIDQIEAAMQATGAFSIPRDSADACLVVTLQPGLYTTVVSGDGSAAGEALIEVYAVPPGQ